MPQFETVIFNGFRLVGLKMQYTNFTISKKQKDERRVNGPYFQNKIEKVPFESRQEAKSQIRREYDIIFAFPNDR